MENASKALLFAAGILIAIILITVAVYLVSMSQDATKDVGSTMSEMQLMQFNQKFTTYDGRRTGSQLKQLVATVNSSNVNNAGTDLLVKFEDRTSGNTKALTSPEDVDGNIKCNAGGSKYYYIKCETTNGAVSKIIVSDNPITSTTNPTNP